MEKKNQNKTMFLYIGAHEHPGIRRCGYFIKSK